MATQRATEWESSSRADAWVVSYHQQTHRSQCDDHEHAAIPNDHERQFAVTEPNQVLSDDVTYIQTGQRRAYFAVILDLFVRKPVDWVMSFSIVSKLTFKTLEMAWEARGKLGGIMFHSDQDSHYTSRRFRQPPRRQRIKPRMIRRGYCWDTPRWSACS